eukprot:CAMPEP_0178860316 /NCGR_PEP_ID=MMETSP0747-20121128/1678_1 /TAXON_ID=913974 /ORGANISM="Nitzschia punctata, Strain CCMP561" /LENGTH=44 /DNA_ID= /DNA_START= /DNA_END= /DNA_ORIENTATION=
MSSKCYQEIYGSMPLEPGEVDVQRFSLFEKCAEEEIREERKDAA